MREREKEREHRLRVALAIVPTMATHLIVPGDLRNHCGCGNAACPHCVLECRPDVAFDVVWHEMFEYLTSPNRPPADDWMVNMKLMAFGMIAAQRYGEARSNVLVNELQQLDCKCPFRTSVVHYKDASTSSSAEKREVARLQHDGEALSAQHNRAESVLTPPCIHAMFPDVCGPVGYLTDHSMVYDGRRCVGNDTHNVGEECPQTEKSIAALLGQQTYRPSASGDSTEEYVNSEESLQPQYVRIKAPCVEVSSDLTGVTLSSSAVHPGRSSEKTLDQIRKDASHEVRWQWMDRCDIVDREWKDFDEARSRELEWAYHNKRSSKLHLIWRIDGACIQGTVCFRTLTFTSVEAGWQCDLKRWKVAKCAWP